MKEATERITKEITKLENNQFNFSSKNPLMPKINAMAIGFLGPQIIPEIYKILCEMAIDVVPNINIIPFLECTIWVIVFFALNHIDNEINLKIETKNFSLSKINEKK